MEKREVTNEELEAFLRSIGCNEYAIKLIYTNPIVRGFYIDQYLIYLEKVNESNASIYRH